MCGICVRENMCFYECEVTAHANPDGKSLLRGAAEEGNALCLEVSNVCVACVNVCDYSCAFIVLGAEVKTYTMSSCLVYSVFAVSIAKWR